MFIVRSQVLNKAFLTLLHMSSRKESNGHQLKPALIRRKSDLLTPFPSPDLIHRAYTKHNHNSTNQVILILPEPQSTLLLTHTANKLPANYSEWAAGCQKPNTTTTITAATITRKLIVARKKSTPDVSSSARGNTMPHGGERKMLPGSMRRGKRSGKRITTIV